MTGKSPKKGGGQSFPVAYRCELLSFLLQNIKGKSRNNIKSMLSRGQVMVSGRQVRQFDLILEPGQTVTVPDHVSGASRLPFDILYEDHELICIDKPAGLLTVATEQETHATAYRILTDYVKADRPDARIHVIHRLDRDTSGVVLFGKNRALKLAFQENWNTLVLKRSYLAVVEGIPEKESGSLHSWLQETSTHLVYSGKPGGGGREAVTHYTLLAQNGSYSLLGIEIDTGRKNQIRVHMKELGHPVAGDKKYGASTNPLGRLGLHANELIAAHPVSGKKLIFSAGTPAAFHRLFGR